MKINKVSAALAVTTVCFAVSAAAPAAARTVDIGSLILAQLKEANPLTQITQSAADNGSTSTTAPATSAPDPQAAEVTKVPAVPEEKPNHLEMVLVLGRSGSMGGLESDTIGGFNSMIEKERKLAVDANVTTVLFNNHAETVYDRAKLADVKTMTDKDYQVGGMTALYDAVGTTIHTVEKTAGIADKGNKVLFVIITDGLENSSKEYTQDAVKRMISDKKEKDGWEFIFLGANIDAEAEAQKIGITQDKAATYTNNSEGVRANYAAVAELAHSLAYHRAITPNWKNNIK